MTTPAHPDDDLFAPTLRPEDDAVEFNHPWNPWSLVVITFFFGLLAGGSLLAFNFPRLGMRRRFYPTLAIVILLSLAQMGVFLWLLYSGYLETISRDSSRTHRWVSRAVSTLIAIMIAAPQQKRYRLFQTSGLPGGNLLWPALAAIGVSLLLSLPLASAAFVRIFAG